MGKGEGNGTIAASTLAGNTDFSIDEPVDKQAKAPLGKLSSDLVCQPAHLSLHQNDTGGQHTVCGDGVEDVKAATMKQALRNTDGHMDASKTTSAGVATTDIETGLVFAGADTTAEVKIVVKM